MGLAQRIILAGTLAPPGCGTCLTYGSTMARVLTHLPNDVARERLRVALHLEPDLGRCHHIFNAENASNLVTQLFSAWWDLLVVDSESLAGQTDETLRGVALCASVVPALLYGSSCRPAVGHSALFADTWLTSAPHACGADVDSFAYALRSCLSRKALDETFAPLFDRMGQRPRPTCVGHWRARIGDSPCRNCHASSTARRGRSDVSSSVPVWLRRAS